MSVEMVLLTLIDANPWQPRLSEDAEHIANLAYSIAEDDLMQIPSGRRVDGRVQLAFGHSRKAAFVLLADLQRKLTDGERIEFDDDSALARAVTAADRALELGTGFGEMPVNILDIDDEAMFRFAVSENVQRKDLSPIETAKSMKRYKDEFGKKSAEIGALFGVNESTVRGTLRLLDLPAGAQEKLARGEISQGAARALLSMQRVMPAKVEDAAKEMIEKAEDTTPDEVVSNFLRSNKQSILLFYDYDRSHGKPRAGNGWLLDMKNFPNRYLPTLTKEDVAAALDLDQDATARGVLAKAENVIGFAADMRHAKDLVHKSYGEKTEILLDPPACTACPMMTRVGGSYYCAMRACYERKNAAWREDIITQASKRLGIERYDVSEKQFRIFSEWQHKALWEEKSPDLRLIEKDLVRGYPSQYGLKDIDTDHFYLVIVGETLEALKAKEKEAKALDKQGLRQINERRDLVVERRERYLWEVVGHFASQMFGGWGNDAVKALYESQYYWKAAIPKWAEKNSKSDPMYIQKVLAMNVLYRMVDITKTGAVWSDTLASVCTDVFAAAAQTGVTLPENLREMAWAMDEEIERAFPQRVSVETEATA